MNIFDPMYRFPGSTCAMCANSIPEETNIVKKVANRFLNKKCSAGHQFHGKCISEFKEHVGMDSSFSKMRGIIKKHNVDVMKVCPECLTSRVNPIMNDLLLKKLVVAISVFVFSQTVLSIVACHFLWGSKLLCLASAVVSLPLSALITNRVFEYVTINQLEQNENLFRNILKSCPTLS